MAHDPKYGQVDIPGVPDDEPVFILRGKDLATPDAIRDYASIARECGSPVEHCAGSLERAAEIEKWQDTHADRVKIAD